MVLIKNVIVIRIGEISTYHRSSKFKDNICQSCKYLKDGQDRVKVSDQIFECPYCMIKDCKLKKQGKPFGIGKKQISLPLFYLEPVDNVIVASRTERYETGNGQKQIDFLSQPIKSVVNNFIPGRNPPFHIHNRGVEHMKPESEKLIANVPIRLNDDA
ncbi:hypothetical protein POM88_046617 [Heracleum sosnowskyi]|uniref:DNA-directed RNA polymerase n=1 Tax=Heracleum sosnowskyi TaxID=360622 RepID=A0AAD8H9J4_9APIA|nr:hypothetical protein POM88_046617 [Heracleum sosnowskyi]